jgi:ATP synthase F1 delta subunit
LKRIKNVKRYARQFLNAIEVEDIPQAIEQLIVISSLIEKDKNFRNLMASPAFNKEEKEKSIDYVAQKIAISAKVLAYLKYLSNAKVMIVMPEIVSAITKIYLEMKKRAKGLVITPLQISKEYEDKVKESLKQVTGRDIDLQFIIDPSLLGGVKIQVGSTMYDSSIKGQLGLLKDKLLSY